VHSHDPLKAPMAATRSQLSAMPVLVIAVLFGVAHMLTNGQYGFHRDEWQFLSDAQHMDWGFVPYPPLTAALEHLGLKMFGLSLVGLRLFSVLAQVLVILASGLMAHDLGGGRRAQTFTAIAVALSPLPMFWATEFQYSSFDLLWWVLIAWCAIRLMRDDEPRWWVAIGILAGLGLQTKYSIAFELAGVLVGVLLTDARRYVANRWFWAGGAIALLLFAPNLAWLIRHDFISYHFLQGIHARDVHQGRADGFLRDQLLLGANLFAVPVWLAGLFAYFNDRRYRMLAWMYVVPVLLFLLAQGRFYYTGGAYPMLLAMGSVVGERWLRALRPAWRIGITTLLFAGVFATGIYATLRIVPIASSGPLRDFALHNNGDLREEIGWDEIVTQVAAIRDALPATGKPTWASSWVTMASTVPSLYWVSTTTCPRRSPRSIRDGCAAIRRRHLPRLSCWEVHTNAPMSFSSIAALLATRPTLWAWPMRKAWITPISLCAAPPASH
jgi:Dolichyl-phosphate-mannose-protein mannosyltransferase